MNLWILWHNKDSQTLQFLFVILGLKTAAALKVLQTSCCMSLRTVWLWCQCKYLIVGCCLTKNCAMNTPLKKNIWHLPSCTEAQRVTRSRMLLWADIVDGWSSAETVIHAVAAVFFMCCHCLVWSCLNCATLFYTSPRPSHLMTHWKLHPHLPVTEFQCRTPGCVSLWHIFQVSAALEIICNRGKCHLEITFEWHLWYRSDFEWGIAWLCAGG